LKKRAVLGMSQEDTQKPTTRRRGKIELNVPPEETNGGGER
jgi:hypothetical protein